MHFNRICTQFDSCQCHEPAAYELWTHLGLPSMFSCLHPVWHLLTVVALLIIAASFLKKHSLILWLPSFIEWIMNRENGVVYGTYNWIFYCCGGGGMVYTKSHFIFHLAVSDLHAFFACQVTTQLMIIITLCVIKLNDYVEQISKFIAQLGIQLWLCLASCVSTTTIFQQTRLPQTIDSSGIFKML